jgi:hypothetical protein
VLDDWVRMVNRTIPPVLVRVVPTAAHSKGGGGGRILSPLRKREREVVLSFCVSLSLSFLFFFLTTFLLFKNSSSFLLHSIKRTRTNERTNEGVGRKEL